MSDIKRASLFGKLNPTCYQAIDSATTFCKMRGNPYVELEHWFQQLLSAQDSDLHRIIREAGIDEARLARDLTKALDKLPRGASSVSDLSQHVEEAVERGWVYSTLMFADNAIRSGYLLIGILKTPGLRNTLFGISRLFENIPIDDIATRYKQVTEGSPENSDAKDGSHIEAGEETSAPALNSGDDFLKAYTTDVTAKARAAQLDPVIGREDEIRQIIDTLMRRRQNNPILTGEAGVGKTAVVEGLAIRIAQGDVPPSIKDVRILLLDVGLLQAGAGVKGEFEDRLSKILDAVRSSVQPIILFIDEAHTLIGAGGAAGTGDAANLLKPALARGELRTIAATTWSEYKKHIEKDPALARRFQNIVVDEPDPEKAVAIMRGVATMLEKHHQVQILDEALEAAVHLSMRFIPARQLPDKAISLIDTACARVALSQHATPAAVDDCRKRLAMNETERDILERETRSGFDVGDKLSDVETKHTELEEELKALEAEWLTEQKLVSDILKLRESYRQTSGNADIDAQPIREELHQKLEELTELQGEHPLIMPQVDGQAVATIVSDWTGIPTGRMVSNEIKTILNLSEILQKRIIGQDHAMQMIARRVRTSRANLDNPSRPIGVFLLVGPSGVGKTETALGLAETLYGGEQNLITINMSEFQEAHTVSTLKGSPPGYVGYGEGGVLTEAVRRRPYSIVLLDEVEKAHSDVHELFFQVFDKGIMEDGEGRKINFKNTLILLTANVGSDLILNMCSDEDLIPKPDGIAKALRQPLLETFPAALLGRLVTVPYYPLRSKVIHRIINLQLCRISDRMLKNHNVTLKWDDTVISLIESRCAEIESGGRMIDAILTNTLLPDISTEFLKNMSEGKKITALTVSAKGDVFDYKYTKSRNAKSKP
ncbi:Chaperone protein ClpB 1 [Pseudovibrio axinellae]|uniref:Chaperone protein ClpB 1 n=1 Tax=Pseudovibrio axinellae TaxID=989403 RepID=A0A165UMT5_9HYPH|nr:type VI secretion system ATPase TssH [Pseudovibrio axinellae]KZL12575.1 Chaperone protein ClpB 1 [Pseudovibrio axinellae]SEP66142.1 type VI secretion system protein VasG [Pseudovibrio axinellae]